MFYPQYKILEKCRDTINCNKFTRTMVIEDKPNLFCLMIIFVQIIFQIRCFVRLHHRTSLQREPVGGSRAGAGAGGGRPGGGTPAHLRLSWWANGYCL